MLLDAGNSVWKVLLLMSPCRIGVSRPRAALVRRRVRDATGLGGDGPSLLLLPAAPRSVCIRAGHRRRFISGWVRAGGLASEQGGEYELQFGDDCPRAGPVWERVPVREVVAPVVWAPPGLSADDRDCVDSSVTAFRFGLEVVGSFSGAASCCD